MADSYIQLPDDAGNDGKKRHTESRTIGVDEVHDPYEIAQGVVANPAASDATLPGQIVPLSMSGMRQLRVTLEACPAVAFFGRGPWGHAPTPAGGSPW